MANNGSFNTTPYIDGSEQRYLTFAWSLNSQSSANNQSVINWSLTGAGGTSTTRWYETGDFKVVINGVTVYQSATRIQLRKGTLVASGTATIPHNADGTKAFSASAEASIYVWTVNSRGSGSWSLPNIPRYATVTQSLLSKTETSAVMKWVADRTVDYLWYSTDNGTNWTGISVADSTNGSYTISGLSADTTYNVKTRIRAKDSQLNSDSAVLAVKTYAWPYANSMPNFTIGNRVTIGIYNPLQRRVKVVMIGANGYALTEDYTTGTSVTGYDSTATVTSLYHSIPNAQQGTYKIQTTYSGQVQIKNGGTYKVQASACKPAIGTVSYQDTNASAVAITGNNQKIVRNQSTPQVSVSGLQAKYEATLASCKVTVNGTDIALTISGTTATGNVGIIDSGTNLTATVTVTDSRGITATKNLTIQMLDWSIPSALISIQRQSNYYSETDMTVDAQYALIGSNAITITYKARKHGTSSWTQSGSLADNVTSTITIDNQYDWDVQIKLVDSFGGTVTYTLYVPRGMPIIYFDRLNNSVGVNCFPKDEKSLELNGVNLERNVMTRSLTSSLSNLIPSTYTKVALDSSNVTGSKLTATNDGGILIGANVSKIMVSGMMAFDTVASTGQRHLRIVKNATGTTSNTLGWNYKVMQSGEANTLLICPILANVTAGDIIYLFYYTSDGNDEIGGNSYGCRTSLTVEVVA